MVVGGREVGLLLSNVMKKNVKNWCAVYSRIMWVRVQLEVEKWMFVYNSGSEKSDEEKVALGKVEMYV